MTPEGMIVASGSGTMLHSTSSVVMHMRRLPLVSSVIALILLACGSQLAEARQYQVGQPVPVLVNHIYPYHSTGNKRHYYDLPFCEPDVRYSFPFLSCPLLICNEYASSSSSSHLISHITLSPRTPLLIFSLL